MAFDWLSFGAGVAEADMAGKQQEFEQALVNFREDKKLVNTLSSNNYARKLDNYDKEVLKLEKIEQAYSTAAKLDKTNAAHVIAQAEQPELYKILTDRDDGSVDTLAQSYASNFTDITNDAGEVTGFKINRKDFILNEPVASDFFKGKDFWDKEAKNISSNTTSFLGGELRKLLGKEPKKVDVTNYLENLNKETDYQVKSFVGEDGKALPDKEYISTVVGDASPLSAFNFTTFKKKNPNYVTRFNSLKDKVVWDSVNKRDNFLNFIRATDGLGVTTETNFKLTKNDTEIEGLDASARGILKTYETIYNQVWSSMSAELLAAQGYKTDTLGSIINVAEINRIVANTFKERSFTITNTSGKNADFVGVIGFNVVDEYGRITIGDKIFDANSLKLDIGSQYQKFITEEAAKIQERWEVNNAMNPTNKTVSAMNYIQESIMADGSYKDKFLKSLDTTQKETTSEEPKQTGNEMQVVTEGGEIGIYNGKDFISFKQLEEEGKIEATLKKYPYLQSEYDKYKSQ